MDPQTTPTTQTADQVAAEPQSADDAVLAQALVEEVSIDGMCGVY
jgi:mycofactocin precursor